MMVSLLLLVIVTAGLLTYSWSIESWRRSLQGAAQNIFSVIEISERKWPLMFWVLCFMGRLELLGSGRGNRLTTEWKAGMSMIILCCRINQFWKRLLLEFLLYKINNSLLFKPLSAQFCSYLWKMSQVTPN